MAPQDLSSHSITDSAQLDVYPILYVDDESPNRIVFNAAFKRDFQILTAESGKRALEILDERPVSVLLADIRMPGMSGIDLCECVREKYPTIQRILVTAYSDQRTAIEAINRGGVLRYLKKPWELDEVKQVLREATSRAHLERVVQTLRGAMVERERLATLSASRAAILHDLANVSTVVSASTTFLGETIDDHALQIDPEALSMIQEKIHALNSSVNHLTRMQKKIQSMGLLKNNGQGIHKVAEIMDVVLELVKVDVPKQVTISTYCEGDLWVWADRLDVTRILINLINNALQAIAKNSGQVTVSATLKGHNVCIRVSDDGPGISDDLRLKVFEGFFSTRIESGGHGLGLSICTELAQANNGTLVLEPSQGSGASFKLMVPAWAPQAQP